MYKYLLFLLFQTSIIAHAQDNTMVAEYVQKGITNNRVIQQKDISVKKGILALQEAKRLWYPDINGGLQYSLAAGGRKIDFAIGDLLNPVYQTLNALTMSNNFPMVENQQLQFLPNNFYDLTVKVTQPIYAPEIGINQKIKATQIDLAKMDIVVYQRNLTKEIEVAYYRFLQSHAVINIYDNALKLLDESLRVNESLLRNGVGLPSAILRTQAEISNVAAQRNDALNTRQNAKAFLNFLINRPATDSVIISNIVGLPDAAAAPLGYRPELTQLSQVQLLQNQVVELKKAAKLPQVGAQLTLGTQAFNFGWGGYALLGLGVEMPIWTFGKNDLRIEQARLDVQSTAVQMEQVQTQITLQETVAMNDYHNKINQYEAYTKQISAAERYYNDTMRRYKEGQSNLIELLDARTQFTNIAIRQSIALHDVWVAYYQLL